MAVHPGPSRQHTYVVAVLVVLAVLLQACSSDSDGPSLPPQQWQDLTIMVQTRPLQVRPGMNEFLIIATTRRGLPGDDMVVSLRTSTLEPWSQSIQDGHSGVYRRAINIRAAQRSILLQLKRGNEQTVLEFPLSWSR